MYLPQPEVKSRSPLMTWTLRLVLIFVGIVVFFFLSLNLLAGKTDAHKRGLEAAMSELIKTPVNIGMLHELNIIPQFRFDVESVTSEKVSIERLKIAYGFWDLFVGRPYIEDINFENLRIPAGVVGPFSVKIDKGFISPDAKFIFLGSLQKNKLEGEIALNKLPQRFRPSYQILVPDVKINLGDTKIQYTAVADQKKIITIQEDDTISEFLFEDSQFITDPESLWVVLQDKQKTCVFLEMHEQADARFRFQHYTLDRVPSSFDLRKLQLDCSKG